MHVERTFVQYIFDIVRTTIPAVRVNQFQLNFRINSRCPRKYYCDIYQPGFGSCELAATGRRGEELNVEEDTREVRCDLQANRCKVK